MKNRCLSPISAISPISTYFYFDVIEWLLKEYPELFGSFRPVVIYNDAFLEKIGAGAAWLPGKIILPKRMFCDEINPNYDVADIAEEMLRNTMALGKEAPPPWMAFLIQWFQPKRRWDEWHDTVNQTAESIQRYYDYTMTGQAEFFRRPRIRTGRDRPSFQ